MSQQQLRRPNESPDAKAVKYGDVFNVSGELASEKIAPRDAAAMQSLESSALGAGEIPKGSPAALLQSAAEHNKAIGAVSNNEATHAAGLQGVTLAQGTAAGHHVIAEAVAGQVIGGHVDGASRPRGGAGGHPENQGRSASPALGGNQITIGEALEAAALMAGDKPVDKSDAAAVEAAEVRATRRGQVIPRGVGARAQAAADLNPTAQEKITLGEAIGAATVKLPGDKAVTREDAVRVMAAELRNDPGGEGPRPGGVASTVAAAARINERAKNPEKYM